MKIITSRGEVTANNARENEIVIIAEGLLKGKEFNSSHLKRINEGQSIACFGRKGEFNNDFSFDFKK